MVLWFEKHITLWYMPIRHYKMGGACYMPNSARETDSTNTLVTTISRSTVETNAYSDSMILDRRALDVVV